MNPLEDVSQPVGDELCFLTVGHIPAPIKETALTSSTQDIHGAENRTLDFNIPHLLGTSTYHSSKVDDIKENSMYLIHFKQEMLFYFNRSDTISSISNTAYF